jgi:hypothetical protein
MGTVIDSNPHPVEQLAAEPSGEAKESSTAEGKKQCKWLWCRWEAAPQQPTRRKKCDKGHAAKTVQSRDAPGACVRPYRSVINDTEKRCDHAADHSRTNHVERNERPRLPAMNHIYRVKDGSRAQQTHRKGNNDLVRGMPE